MNPYSIQYERILFPTNLTDASLACVPFVASVAKRLGARVDVLHNLEGSDPIADSSDSSGSSTPPTPSSQNPGEQIASAHRSEEALTEQVAKQFENSGVEASAFTTRAAKAALAIREHATDSNSDLILLLSTSDETIMDRLLGTTASDLIGESPCDVLFFTPTDAEQSGAESSAAFERVLVPVNYEEESVASLGRALTWSAPGNTIELFYDVPATFPYLHTARGITSDHSVDEDKVEEVWREELRAFWAQHGDEAHQPVLRRGDGGWLEDVREAAEEDRCDLIVATENPGRFRGLAEKLASEATTCPVLLVRVPGDAEILTEPHLALDPERHQTWVRPVLDFWFGELDEFGLAAEAKSARWWGKDDQFDQEIRTTFGELHKAAEEGRLQAGREPRAELARIILLDQFSRNLGRGTAAMFNNDQTAIDLAREMISRGDDRRLPTSMQAFCYLPYMHSEKLEDQETCVALFRVMLETATEEQKPSVENSLQFAQAHRDIVRRFGRFPHRNEALGRPSTEEEVLFLQEDGSSF